MPFSHFHMCCRATLGGLLLSTVSALAATVPPSRPAAGPLTTLAERSGFHQTGRYAEVQALCRAFARRYPRQVRCESFGRTPEGRPMQVLVVTRSGALSPAEAARRQLPVTLVQGGIHAGEIDGKDAGFLALRQILDGEAGVGVLDHQVLLFVPVFNVDGHERFGAWNRPNQRGPEAMGWRTTGQNLNLNRDYAKADAPEMQAMLALIQRWDPLATIDLHVTDGAQFEHDVAIQVEPLHSGDEGLHEGGRALRDGVIAALSAQGSLPLPFYPSFRVEDDPSSGFVDGVPAPRFCAGYFAWRNRYAMLVETHSWKDYPTRVRITRNTVLAVLDQVARHGADWRAAADAADQRALRLGGQAVTLAWTASTQQRLIDFRGYAYTRTASDISGALMTRYDETSPQVWQVPIRDDLQPSTVVVAPRGGYLVAPAHAAAVAAKLGQHGISSQVLSVPLSAGPVQVFRAGQTRFSPDSFEGRQALTLSGAWATEQREVPAGSLFVPVAQPRARLVMALLEPAAPDALVRWGWFNSAFEQKEYMEPYVAEAVARTQLAADPTLAAQFGQKLAEDPAFAASPAQRLAFFERRHPSWDERFNLYPVLRTDTVPER
jgi:murein tripeptide amidase MpaA